MELWIYTDKTVFWYLETSRKAVTAGAYSMPYTYILYIYTVWLCVCVCVHARALLPLNISWDFFLRSEESFSFSINRPPCLSSCFTITVFTLPHHRSLSWAKYISSIHSNILRINLKISYPHTPKILKNFLSFKFEMSWSYVNMSNSWGGRKVFTHYC